MFRWLPAKLTILSTAITRYACQALWEVGALERLCIISMVCAEARILAEGPDSWIYLAAPNRSPRLPWSEIPNGEILVAPLMRRPTPLGNQDLVNILTTRGGPLQRYDARRVATCVDSPARAARLGYLCCVRAARREGIGGPTSESDLRSSAADFPSLSALAAAGSFRKFTEGKNAAERAYESSSFSKSLVLVALGSLGMQLQHPCEKCFRQAVPGLKRCAEHSQSTAASVRDGKPVNARRTQARAAETVTRLLGGTSTTRDLEALKRSRASQLYGAIFDRPIGDADLWREMVARALESAPTVRARLPAALDLSRPPSVLRLLRRTLDPLEHDPWAWPEKIRRANDWIERYEQVAPGKPPSGPQRKTRQRIEAALALRQKGVDDETIARQLDMTLRAMKAMLRRHGH